MVDWPKIVREHLQAGNLLSGDLREVTLELAFHLEETYEEACSRGLTEEHAMELALREVPDWQMLAEDIEHAKCKEDPMNRRTKTLWVPGMASLLGASLFMALLQWVGVRPRLIWVDAHMAMTFYWPWLASLPIFGAVGAYLSRRAGGEIRTRLAAGLSPVWWLFLLSIALFPMEMLHQGYHLPELRYYVLGMANWVAIPAFALLIGELPFLRAQQRAST
jgi:hypothetical protein